MKNEIAIKIEYYVLGKSSTENYGEDDVDQFRDEIQNDYVVTFNKKAAERGGGHFIIEFLLNLKLEDYLMMIIGGLAWDLVKMGTRQFFLKPFIERYIKFRETTYAHDIRDIIFNFSDTKLHIYSVIDNSPEVNFAIISKVFQKLASNYNKIDIDKNNKLTDIHIPMFLDETGNKNIYRQKLEFDDPIELELMIAGKENDVFTQKAYFKYWGLAYFNYERKVYNLEKQELLNSNWRSEDEYFWEQKNKTN